MLHGAVHNILCLEAKQLSSPQSHAPLAFVFLCLFRAHQNLISQKASRKSVPSSFSTFRVHSPVSVSVVEMCEWKRVSLFPEGPGPYRCPASSSYTVYTKLCMYKIEKSAKKTKRKCDILRVLFYWKNKLCSLASKILSAPSMQQKEMCDYYFYMKSLLCVQLTAHYTIQNTACPHRACKDTQLAQWQSSFAENLGQGGRSTQCPFTNSADPESAKQHKHCATSTRFAHRTAKTYHSRYVRNSVIKAKVCIEKDKTIPKYL